MEYQQSFGMKDNRTPIQCRNGPLEQSRKCTDAFCCILYLLLVGVVVAFAVLSASALKIPRSQLQQQVMKSEFAGPFIALGKSFFSICLGLVCVAAICLFMLILAFIIPQIVTYIFIPLCLLLSLVLGSAFIYVYFGKTLPFLSPEKQARFIDKNSWLALGCGILFLTAFLIIILVIITKKQRFRNIIPVLKIAKTCFWQNTYMLFISLILSIISMVIWYINIYLLQVSQDRKDTQHYIDSRIMSLIIIVEILWTHGLMQGVADFVFESIGINWYFNQAKYGQGYSRCHNLTRSITLLFTHIGTISLASLTAYIPQQINAFMQRFRRNCTSIYTFCCFCHRFTIRKLSKYGFCQTILQSQSFCQANREMFELKHRTKETLPEVYMAGNFFTTICKTLVMMFSLVIVYFLLVQQDEEFYLQNILNLIVPLLVTLFATSEICNHFMGATGLIGDTIIFMYTVDIEIEKKDYGETEPYSCPRDVRMIIQEVANYQ